MAKDRNRRRLPVHATRTGSQPQSGGLAALSDPVGMGGFGVLKWTIASKAWPVAGRRRAGVVSFAWRAVI